MGPIIYSVPHTGTRFVQSFFTHCGIKTSRRHVGHKLIGKGQTEVPDGPRIIPVRNPYDCYMSWHYLHPEKSLVDFVGLWGKLVWRSREGAFFFPLDIEEEHREQLMQEAPSYVGCYNDISCKTFSWRPVNKSDRNRELECPDEMKQALSFAHEWYEYYTVNWGQ